jgi:hypothetical protein
MAAVFVLFIRTSINGMTGSAAAPIKADREYLYTAGHSAL